MTPLRIAVMGCASVAKRMVLPAMQKTDAIELVAVASRTLAKAEEFAAEFGCEAVEGYDTILERDDIDAIYMPLPTGMHAEWAERTLKAGKHLFIEKSLAMNAAEAEAMIDLARQQKLAVRENYMFEYHPQQDTVRAAIGEQAGTVRLFRASFGFPPLPDGNFRYDVGLGGGALLDAGGYVLKAMKVFFPGATVRILSSSLTNGPSGADISGAVMAEITDGDIVIPAHLAFGFDHHYQCGIEVWGSQAKISTNRTFTAGPAVTPKMVIETAGGASEVELPQDDHFKVILEAFAASVREQDFEPDYDAILTQARLQAEVRSSAS